MNHPTTRETGVRKDLPTATIDTLRNRAKLIAEIRAIFDQEGYFEVETPLVSADIVVDAWLEPFVTSWTAEPANWRNSNDSRYLQTSPEFAMKRLIAAGADSIYQLGKVFRNGEFGQRHNPEFTMLEWYRKDDDLTDLMAFTEIIVRRVIALGNRLISSNEATSAVKQRADDKRGFERLTYADAFQIWADCSVLTCGMDQLHSVARKRDLIPPPGLAGDDRDGWLNFLLAELIEPNLGRDRPMFLTHYPASQAALARLSTDGQTAERFELYINGIELCNGYDELTDASLLRNRIREQSALREQAGLRPLPQTSRLLSAMDAGLPPCSGNALGVDRLVMLALQKRNLAEVIPFPFDIA